MMSERYILLALLFGCSLAFAQQPVRKFPTSINHPSIDVYAPFISLDGSSMVYSSFYGLEQEVIIYFTERARGDWKTPVELPKFLNSKLNMKYSYTLSPEGSTLYLTCIKSGGVGRFDIWYSERTGNTWGQLRNMFAPINTKDHDGTPTFTPDGRTMYFMRCDQMTQQGASGCKIYVSNKDNLNKWQEPQELPETINTGNSQFPRIMADGETLIFASDVIQPNKGGMDLYYSKYVDGTWQKPLPLDFANTDKMDQFVSAMASGRYLTMGQKGERRYEIIDKLIPEDIRPKAVMKVEGTVLDPSGSATPAYISVVNTKTGERTFNGRPEPDGSFFLYMTEGNKYDLSIDPELGTQTFFSRVYDLTQGTVPMVDRVEVVQKELEANDEIELSGFTFKEHSSELIASPSGLRRLTRLMNAADLDYEIQVMLIGYEEDSVMSSPDLTELRMDTVLYEAEVVDSLGQVTVLDSMAVEPTYHNNRTEKQAKAIIERLVAEGVEEKRLSYFFNARTEAVLENRKTVVRVAARRPN